MPYSRSGAAKKQRGFTLIEIVIGIVTLAIAMTLIISLIVPAEQKSADNIHQIKAAELGQAMLDEILGRAFDHHSDHSGGVWRCGETGHSACSSTFGPESGETRSLYNDVDDYHQYSALLTPTSNALHSGYGQFQIDVQVSYGGTALGLTNTLAKLVVVTVTTPAGEAIEFSAFKSNF